MAFVKTCPTCGFGNVLTTPFCSQCGVSLVAVAPAEQVVSPVTSVCPDCGAENEASAERCVYCDCAITSSGAGPELCHVELTWPWGKESLTKPLRIGREPPAPESLMKAINSHGYDNISRSHAELLPDPVNGGVSVIDFGSVNGTFVDGIRIPPNTPTVLKSGAVVRFAANLSVTVAFARTRFKRGT